MAAGSNTSRRGFASMSPEKQREISSRGGKSVPADTFMKRANDSDKIHRPAISQSREPL